MPRSSTLVCALVLVFGALLGCRPDIFKPRFEMDPALWAEDPSAFRGDDWDRRAATLVDSARGTRLLALVGKPGTEREVVETLRTTSAREGASERMPGKFATAASDVLLIRRARAAYAAAAEAMAMEGTVDRQWGLDAFELVEGRRRTGSSEDTGPPYSGPERDAALSAVAHILTSDASAELRHQAVMIMEQVLPDHDEPSPEALAATLAKEEGDDHRTWLLWLMRTRKAPAGLILDAAMHGYEDPVTVSVGIHDLFVEENRALLEKAFTEGDAVGRAGIGETFYRHQSPMPWAEPLILRGLADPDRTVRANFAKGTLVLRPFNATVRATLEAMKDGVPNAAWALSVEAEEEESDGER